MQIPDIGATLRERLAVPVASLAFGRLKFMVRTSLDYYWYTLSAIAGFYIDYGNIPLKAMALASRRSAIM